MSAETSIIESSGYRNPPIHEAVLEVRVQLPDTVSAADLASMNLGREKEYPDRKDRGLIHGSISTKPSFSTTTSRTHMGFQWTSSDGLRVYQARLDGFAFSHLQKYGGWPSFSSEARRLWADYRKLFRPSQVKRLAVRYINRIVIPFDAVDLSEYLRVHPEMPGAFPSRVADFYVRLQLPIPDEPFTLVLNESIGEPSGDGKPVIVLDLDLFQTEEVPQDEDALWATMARLRNWKNKIFEWSITDKTREGFK